MVYSLRLQRIPYDDAVFCQAAVGEIKPPTFGSLDRRWIKRWLA